MKVFGLVVAFVVIVLFDLRGLLKTKKRTKTMVVYFFLIALGFTLSFLYIMGRAPKSPAVIMEKFIRMIIPGKYTVQ